MQLTESPRTVDTVTAEAVQELIDRQEIVDVLHRFALGRDLKDRTSSAPPSPTTPSSTSGPSAPGSAWSSR